MNRSENLEQFWVYYRPKYIMQNSPAFGRQYRIYSWCQGKESSPKQERKILTLKVKW